MFIQIRRIAVIVVCLALSTIMFHITRAPSYIDMHKVQIACLPLTADTPRLDRELRHYYHIAHTTQEGKNAEHPSYRCYFRFPSKDVTCMPTDAAKRHSRFDDCPCYVSSAKKACYFLTKRYAKLLDLLRKKPPVSREKYDGQIVPTWQDVRDVLIGRRVIATPSKK